MREREPEEKKRERKRFEADCKNSNAELTRFSLEQSTLLFVSP